MKRPRDEFEQEVQNQVVNECGNPKRLYDLADDNLVEICKYLPSGFLLTNCILISKQWLRVIEEGQVLLSVTTIKPLNYSSSEQLTSSRFLNKIEAVNCSGSCIELTRFNVLEINKNAWANVEKALGSMIHLTTLDVSRNQIDYKGAKSISEMKQITSLNVSNNPIGVEGAKAISEIKNLTILNITNTWLQTEGAKVISEMKQLTNLNISDNILGVEGAKPICGIKNLTILNISNNFLGDMGAKSISELEHLTSLDISQNYIECEGAKYICNLKHLTYLDLSKNNIEDEGKEYVKNNIKINGLVL